MMLPVDWFREWFNSPYYHQLYFEHNEKEANLFINRLIDHLQPAKDSIMLDIACGRGRHSQALADKGFDVTGTDIAPDSIAFAKKFETITSISTSMTLGLPFWINYFDHAFNFFTSFGYFRTEREHYNAIRTIAQSLKKGGTFVLDYLNIHYAEDHLIHKSQKEINGVTYYLTKWYDETHFYKRIVVIQVILAADIIVMANLAQIAGLYTFELFGADHYANSTFWVTVVGVLWIVIMTWICDVGIEVSAKVQWGLLSAEILILGLFAVVALYQVYFGNAPGSIHPSLSWINPLAISSWGALSAGLITAIFIYWGWDSTVAVNEETEDAAHTPGKAAIASTIILVGIYLVDSIAAQSVHGAEFLTNNSDDVFSALAHDVLGSPLDKLVILAGADLRVRGHADDDPADRADIPVDGAHGAIPRMFAKIHPRYLTPSTSTSWMGGLSIGWYIVMTKISPNVLGASISALGLMIAFYYGLTGIACPIFYRRHLTKSVKNFLMIGIAPLIGAAILFFAFFKSSYDFVSDKSYGSVFGIGLTFVIGIGFLLLGVVLMLVSVPFFPDFFRRKPEVVDPDVAVHGAGAEPVPEAL